VSQADYPSSYRLQKQALNGITYLSITLYVATLPTTFDTEIFNSSVVGDRFSDARTCTRDDRYFSF
jgi:hypothetical protein